MVAHEDHKPDCVKLREKGRFSRMLYMACNVLSLKCRMPAGTVFPLAFAAVPADVLR